MKLLYGTGNPAKLASMKRIVKKLGIELIGLKDLDCEIPNVLETGRTPLEYARQKALAYYHAFHIPVFSCDSGLHFDGILDDIQPGVHVRTIAGKRLTNTQKNTYDYQNRLTEMVAAPSQKGEEKRQEKKRNIPISTMPTGMWRHRTELP